MFCEEYRPHPHKRSSQKNVPKIQPLCFTKCERWSQNCDPHAVKGKREPQDDKNNKMTVGFLYGAGAETLIFVTGTSEKYPKIFVSRQKNRGQMCIHRKPRKIGVWVSGAEIQTSAVDTRTAVWVSTAEKLFKIVLGETRNFSRKFRGFSAPAWYKNPAVKKQTQTKAIKK